MVTHVAVFCTLQMQTGVWLSDDLPPLQWQQVENNDCRGFSKI